MAHLFRVGRAGGRTFDREVVHAEADIAAVDLGEADDLAVAGGLRLVLLREAGRAEQAGLDEAALIDQQVEALLRV